jgi:hypothetical protein
MALQFGSDSPRAIHLLEVADVPRSRSRCVAHRRFDRRPSFGCDAPRHRTEPSIGRCAASAARGPGTKHSDRLTCTRCWTRIRGSRSRSSLRGTALARLSRVPLGQASLRRSLTSSRSSLAQGKSVLFVAEKAAAREVVERRLGGVGLGDFLLKLHSRQSSKAGDACEPPALSGAGRRRARRSRRRSRGAGARSGPPERLHARVARTAAAPEPFSIRRDVAPDQADWSLVQTSPSPISAHGPARGWRMRARK